MQPLTAFSQKNKIKFVFTDIDGTLTGDGRLPENSYRALWQLHKNGCKIIPVTGRPAGWCDLVARFWPVHGVIGENGGLIYQYNGKKMKRYYALNRHERAENRKKLQVIAQEIKRKVPNSRIAADQFARLFDLAIDFAEDIPALPQKEIKKIAAIFAQHGAHAKISNIHVNGWFGDFDKLSTCRVYCQKLLGFALEDNLEQCLYVGDSPNDEPMFAYFRYSVGVANVREYLSLMKSHPTYITKAPEAAGFAEVADLLIRLSNQSALQTDY